MGVEVVLPNGEIIESGTRSIRRPAGLDHTRLFVGSEGLFGVITKIRLRVIPDPKRAYIVGFFPELSDIARAFQRYYREKLPPPLYGELLDKRAARAPFQLRGMGEPKGHMGLAITISHTQEEADRQARDMVRVFKAEGAIDAFVATSKKDQIDYWEARDNILNILQASGDDERLIMVGSVESAVPLSHLVDAIEYLQGGHSYSALKSAKLFVYGHIGTCDIHGMWVAPVDTPLEERKRIGTEAVQLERDLCLMWGCASGEVGQTASRIPFFKKRYGEAAHAMLTAVKKAIDPNNILNPGNLEGDGYESI
jgi:glycolate oxidase